MHVTRLSRRVLARLVQAEACEQNPHFRDDLRIARLTVAYAASCEAGPCSPHVLASYMVLGLHPEKVWPAILARRESLLGPMFQSDAPPKKLAQSVKLWPFKKTNGARAVNSRAAIQSSGEPAISVPMAAPSIAAGYPNSEAPSTRKKGEYFYDEAIRIVKCSGAPDHVRQLTLDALAVRGPWPKKKGPITNVFTVSIRSLQDEGGVYRSTIQRRIRRATKDNYWRELHPINHWLNCPKCGAERASAQCPKCDHKGNGHNPEEFRTTITHAIDFEKFERTPPCRQVREIRELRARHSPKAIAQMPRPEPVAEQPAPALAPVKQPAAEHAHRNTRHISRDERTALFNAYLALKRSGMAHEKALGEVVRQFKNRFSSDDVEFALKIASYKNGQDVTAESQSRTFVPPKCRNCEDAGQVWNKGPGPRKIPCPDCSQGSS